MSDFHARCLAFYVNLSRHQIVLYENTETREGKTARSIFPVQWTGTWSWGDCFLWSHRFTDKLIYLAIQITSREPLSRSCHCSLFRLLFLRPALIEDYSKPACQANPIEWKDFAFIFLCARTRTIVWSHKNVGTQWGRGRATERRSFLESATQSR